MMHSALFTLVVAALGTQTGDSSAITVAQAASAAVAISPQVDLARAHVAETRSLLEAAQRSAAPQLVASQVEVPQAGSNGGTIEQSLTTLGGSYSFTDLSQRGSAVGQARAALSVAEVELREAERIERGKAIDRYYDALKAASELTARRSQFIGSQRDLDAARIRFRAGDAPHIDVVRGEVEVARATLAVDAAQVALDNALDAISTETGIAASRFTVSAALQIPAMPAGDEAALIARALTNRPDVGSAREAVAVERTGVSVAQRSGAPNITLAAGYTQGTDSGFHIGGPNATLQVAVPVGGPTKSRVQAQTARVQQAELRVTQLERDIRLEVAAALRNAQAAERAVRAAAATQNAAHDELRAVERGYAAGASTSLDVSEARRVDAEAVIAALDARYAEARARTQLLEVIGS